MSVDHNLFPGRSNGTSDVGTLPASVVGKRRFFYPSMNSGFFKGLEGSRLSVRQTCLDPAFGESPASAPGLNQEEFDVASADAVANSSDLFPSVPFGYFCRRKKGCDPDPRPDSPQT